GEGGGPRGAQAATRRGRAPHGAGGADGGRRAGDPDLGAGGGLAAAQGLALGAAVLVPLAVGDEAGQAVAGGAVPVIQRDVGADPLLLEGGDDLEGGVVRVPGRLPRTQPPAQPGAPEQVEGRLVVAHLRR